MAVERSVQQCTVANAEECATGLSGIERKVLLGGEFPRYRYSPVPILESEVKRMLV